MVRYQPPKDWQQWVDWLAAGLHGRSRWRLSLILLGMLFARGRRTVTTWLRAAGITTTSPTIITSCSRWDARPNVCRAAVDHAAVADGPPDRVLLVVDDTPTKRYGPKVQGAGIHHNPTPGPADQKFLYGHIWVTISLALRHPLWRTIGLPLAGLLYVRAKDIAKIPQKHGLEVSHQAGTGGPASVAAARKWLKRRENRVGRGRRGLCQAAVFETLAQAGVVVVSRLRKDAALCDLPRLAATARRGRPRQVRHEADFSWPRRAAHPRGWQTVECFAYGKAGHQDEQDLPGHLPAGRGHDSRGDRQEDHGCEFFFSTDPAATPREILEAFADRAAIEQDFHDVKEVWGLASSKCATSGRTSPCSI